jgi:murein DD-endopeptidase MepM/ murein hydrolase activator NlpD
MFYDIIINIYVYRSGDNMQKVTLFFTFLITLAISTAIIVFFENDKANANVVPRELYQVYLSGEKIGVIESKEKLEKYIDNKQEEIKKKYGVKKVYPPKDLNIQKYVGYDNNILSEEKMYEKISKKSPFTIKGYIVKIKSSTEGVDDKKINVLDKSLFEDAGQTVIEHFVGTDNFKLFLNDEQQKIDSTGKIISSINYSGLTITEAYISVNEYIFTDKNELTKYLLFGTLEEQDKYIVKSGDTIEQIAFDHKLGTEEFLVVNPDFSSSSNLLFPGQEVSVGLINPLISVVVDEYIVEDQTINFETETTYDDTLAYGATQVKQEGSTGIQRIVEKRETTNGVITNVKIDTSSTTVIREPVKKIIVKGTKHDDGTIQISPDGNWVWPTNSPYVITTYFGYRWRTMHPAIDIAGCGYGSAIRAARAGTVITSGYEKTRGNYIVVAHDDNYYTMYLHLSKRNVVAGQTVAGGQVIGAMGNTGYVVGTTGIHLHFAVNIGEPYKAGSKAINPLLLYR